MEKARCYVYFSIAVLAMFLFPICSFAQSVTITAPTAKAIFQHSNGLSDIPVTATATGVPSGGGVEFVLDMGTAVQVSAKEFSSPYSYTFRSIPLGEHTLDAFVINSSGSRVSSSYTIYRVGVGDIIVTVGDSITAGLYDDITTDNWSIDGRNGPYYYSKDGKYYGGFQPILNDMLTSVQGYPHSIINEGLPSETSSGGKSRIASIITRNPTAKTWLIAYGTNDANAHMAAGTYMSNLQSIISRIQATVPGASVYIPKIFYFDETDSDYNLVMKYHRRISDIVRATPNVYRGADLHDLFRSNHRSYEHRVYQSGTWFSPNVTHHPNGIGVQKMAMLWKMALIDRAILVTDGGVESIGGAWADGIIVDGITNIGLNQNNLLQVCEKPRQDPPPAGTSFLGNWSVRLMLTNAQNFAGGSVGIMACMEDKDLPTAGATSWNQAWVAKDTTILPTTRQVDAGTSTIHYLLAQVSQPGQIAPVADVTPPVTTCTLIPMQPANGSYYTLTGAILQATDSTGLPVASTYYKLDSDNWTLYTAPIAIPAGNHTLYYYSIDQSGNVESQKSDLFQGDSTPPTTPVVASNARFVEPGSSVDIIWYSEDPETGIDEYQYAIGLIPEGTSVKDWTSVGTSTSMSWTPTLTAGTTYYFSVKARNGDNIWSAIGRSEGITVPYEMASPGSVGRLPDFAPVLLRHVNIVSGTNGTVYAEQADGSSRIRLLSQSTITLEQDVNIVGWTGNSAGERVLIDAERYSPPVASPFDFSTITSGQLSLTDPLIRAWGKVKSVGTGWILISDGVTGGDPGLYVNTQNINFAPLVNSWVTLTGTNSVINVGTTQRPAVKPRSQTDLVIYSWPSQ